MLLRRTKHWLKTRHPDWLRILRLLRVEGQLAAVRLQAACSPRQWTMRRQLLNAQDLRIQIGCGENRVPGWINIDCTDNADLRIDIRAPWPLTSGSVQYIFSEHFLDHMEYPDGVACVLRECFRVLKPGGIVRVVVHDAEALLQAYLSRDYPFFENMGVKIGPDGERPTLNAYINHIFRFNGLHQFIYDFETLEHQFRKAGFAEVQKTKHRSSAIKELNLDLDLPDRAPQSLYVEAVR